MASNTKQTRFRRKLRRKRAGTDRKAALRIHGSTPAFEVHTPDAVENAKKVAAAKS